MEQLQADKIGTECSTPKRRWLPQFSLGNLLMLVCLTGALMGLIKVRSEAEEERILRLELEEKLESTLELQKKYNRHYSVVSNLGKSAEGKWNWLVEVPKGKKWKLKYLFLRRDEVNGYASVAGTFEEGRYELEATIGKGRLIFDAKGDRQNFGAESNVLYPEQISIGEIQQLASDRAFPADELPKSIDLLKSSGNQPFMRVWLEPTN